MKTLTLDDIVTAVTTIESLKKEVEGLKETISKLVSESGEVVNQKAAAKLLGVSAPTIIRYRREGLLKEATVFSGKTIKYNRIKLEQIKEMLK